MGNYPMAEDYWRKCISIPLFPKMTNEDVELVIESVKRATNGEGIGNGG
jgi:dTDP-4-amino-4,6-dideoxygalactose transaminase